MRSALWAGGALVILLAAGCSSEERHVRIDLSIAGGAVVDAAQVRVRIDKDGAEVPEALVPEEPGADPIVFPTDLVVLIGDWAGTLGASVEAVDADGRARASGAGTTEVAAGGEGRVGVITIVLGTPGGNVDAGPGVDGGLDGGVDAGADAGADAAVDAGPIVGGDSGADAGEGTDGGADAAVGIDGGLDAGVGIDGGLDAGVGIDGGLDAGIDSGYAPDAGADSGPPPEPMCGDGIPVRGELCFGELRMFVPPENGGALTAAGGYFAIGSRDDDGIVDALVSSGDIASLGDDVLDPPWSAENFDESADRIRSLVFADLDDEPGDDIAILRGDEGDVTPTLRVWDADSDDFISTNGNLESIVAARLFPGDVRRLVGAGDALVSVQGGVDGSEMVDSGLLVPGTFGFLASGFLDPGDAEDVVVATNDGGWVVTVLLSDGAGGFLEPLTDPVGWTIQGIAAGDIDGDEVEEIVVAQRGSQTVHIYRVSNDQLESDSFQAGVVTDDVAVHQLDGTGKEEVVAAAIESAPPDVEIWDLSGAEPELRLVLGVPGAEHVQFIDSLRAWPESLQGAYVPPWLWTIPRRDLGGGFEWPTHAGFWPPDP